MGLDRTNVPRHKRALASTELSAPKRARKAIELVEYAQTLGVTAKSTLMSDVRASVAPYLEVMQPHLPEAVFKQLHSPTYLAASAAPSPPLPGQSSDVRPSDDLVRRVGRPRSEATFLASVQEGARHLAKLHDEAYLKGEEPLDCPIFAHPNFDCDWTFPLEDVHCKHICFLPSKRFFAVAETNDGHEFRLRCWPEHLLGWPSAVTWLRAHPEFSGVLSMMP
jgi:hypothetical protein